jgi:hypothetical protein
MGEINIFSPIPFFKNYIDKTDFINVKVDGKI